MLQRRSSRARHLYFAPESFRTGCYHLGRVTTAIVATSFRNRRGNGNSQERGQSPVHRRTRRQEAPDRLQVARHQHPQGCPRHRRAPTRWPSSSTRARSSAPSARASTSSTPTRSCSSASSSTGPPTATPTAPRLFFVGTREYTGQTFGGRIDNVQDPQTGLIITLRVFGDYSMQVVDPTKLILNLVGTVNVENNEDVTYWMSNQLLKVMRTEVTRQIVRNGWPILGLVRLHPRDREGRHRGRQHRARRVRHRHRPHGQLRRQPRRAGRGEAQGPRQRHRLQPPRRQLRPVRPGSALVGAGEGMAQGGGGTAGRVHGRRHGHGRRHAGQQPMQQGPTPPPAPASSVAAAATPRPGRGGRRRGRLSQLRRRQRAGRQVLLQLRPGDGAAPVLHQLRCPDGPRRPLLRRVRHLHRATRAPARPRPAVAPQAPPHSSGRTAQGGNDPNQPPPAPPVPPAG